MKIPPFAITLNFKCILYRFFKLGNIKKNLVYFLNYEGIAFESMINFLSLKTRKEANDLK
jgi:hypothetical protein